MHAVPDLPLLRGRSAQTARAVLAEAALRARAGQPHLKLDTEIVTGSPDRVLVSGAAGAQLLVAGRRGQGGLTGLLLGTVVLHLVHAAPCPVVVIGEHHHPRTAEIAVGVTGHPGQQPVLEFAFTEADLRASALRAVHAWTHPVSRAPGDMLPLVYDVEAVADEERRVLAEAVAGWREKFPDVAVRLLCAHANTTDTLIDASDRADLLVLGLRGRRLTGAIPGSVTHAVLHHARCPVAVIR
ncbi:hypothetical protein Psi01_69610 [Planobispora siamensis]|uniref:UspA domain-containing protein n=1 Tax=Planobispora siamensis TaxID=936338 RepID=A0A8J3WQZ8_9ACTN|nr:hypothetical protein Psi01_69610 [Planobispora siamensis]